MLKSTLGKRIRSLRQAEKLTLADLSKQSKVALATLSRIETGRMTGTLQSHIAIAKAIGVPLSDLYEEITSDQPLILVRRKNESGKLVGKHPGAFFSVLTSNTLAKRMLPLLSILKPGQATPKEKADPGIEKFLYVVAGKLEVKVGTETHRLSAGDSIYFAATLPHSWRNTSSAQAKCLCVISPPAL